MLQECPNCHTKLPPENTIYCPTCGARIQEQKDTLQKKIRAFWLALAGPACTVGCLGSCLAPVAGVGAIYKKVPFWSDVARIGFILIVAYIGFGILVQFCQKLITNIRQNRQK